jgi:hypothetical protein
LRGILSGVAWHKCWQEFDAKLGRSPGASLMPWDCYVAVIALGSTFGAF